MKFFRRSYLAVAAVGALFLSSTTPALACACCADPGTYSLKTNELIGDYRLDLIQGMEFGASASLFLVDGPEREEQVKGLASNSDSYAVIVVTEPKQWRLTFRAEDGKTGVLTLPRPARMTAFVVDTHDCELQESGTPFLYKEWRFEGSVKGDGIFAEGFASSVRYSLVFQGRGNRCDNTEDFTHWRLELTGKKASYAFFGELLSGEPSTAGPPEEASPSPTAPAT